MKRQKSAQKAFMTRKQQLYDNCQLLAPDGKCLTLCGRRKTEWYIKHGLAYKVGDYPLTIKLNFEPSGRPASEKDYYLQEKENVCVVCGSEENHVRKQVVPQEYRKYFPTTLKDHSSHDILLLCVPCHLKCADYETAVRQFLMQECDAPANSGQNSKCKLDMDLAKVVSAAKALLKSHDQIPESRLLELHDTVQTFYGVQSLSEDLLRQACTMDTKVNNSKFIPHGKKVVEHYMQKDGGLLEFEKMWRQHFIEEMQPKYLPAQWSIDHRLEQLKP